MRSVASRVELLLAFVVALVGVVLVGSANTTPNASPTPIPRAYSYDLAAHPSHATPAASSTAPLAAASTAMRGAVAVERVWSSAAKGFAAEDVPLSSGKLYVNGSKSANNLTPRLTDTDGLSSFDTIEAGIKPGGKGQCFDVACLREGGLGAFKTGPPGHYSIRPLEPGGLDEWLASRAAGTEADSPFTQFLQSIAETVWNR